MADHGVLFLDELPEFQRKVLDSLREPLETGMVSVARVQRTLDFPARFQLVAAMNPCPCGWLGHPRVACSCRPDRVDSYRNKISGPLLDRIELNITLTSIEAGWAEAPISESSDSIRGRVLACRQRQLQRQNQCNARLPPGQIAQTCPLNTDARQLLKLGIQRWNWSGRAAHGIIKVARTLADLQSCDLISAEHIAEAMRYRQPWAPLASFLDKHN